MPDHKKHRAAFSFALLGTLFIFIVWAASFSVPSLSDNSAPVHDEFVSSGNKSFMDTVIVGAREVVKKIITFKNSF